MREDEIYRLIGRRLRMRRRMLDMTQRQVAISCGTTFQQIQKYEAGMVAMPFARLVKLAHALQAPLGELVDGLSGVASDPPAELTAREGRPEIAGRVKAMA